ncbi:LysE family translocator [Pseudomonas oryzihabitans]|uniref:LysE family translocator n=1 Tax=Pseudomonas oryzihabitans TaxID=47885 RepID=UPI0021D83BF8|nr:LysE family translocator [Pseudomonas oryzihabitans]
MSISILAAFWVVSFLFVITPGVDWAYMISAGIRGRVVLSAAVGLLSGHLAATVIVAAGVGALLADSPTLLSILSIAGALYLLWLGFGLALRPPAPKVATDEQGISRLRWMTKGFCISGLNPKVLLLFLALLPQFTDPHGTWSTSRQMLALGSLHVLSCGVIYLLVGFGAQAVLRTRPAAARVVSRLSGIAMILIAAILLTDQLRA